MTVAVHPLWAAPGGRVLLSSEWALPDDGPPRVFVGQHDAHVVAASRNQLRIVVPAAAEGGAMAVTVGHDDVASASIEVARTLTTGLHQVDNPAFDGLGRLYATQSGGQGTKVPAPLYRVTRDGVREPVAVEIANPTSLALGPDGALYVSSRFEGTVYRVMNDCRPKRPSAALSGVAVPDAGGVVIRASTRSPSASEHSTSTSTGSGPTWKTP